MKINFLKIKITQNFVLAKLYRKEAATVFLVFLFYGLQYRYQWLLLRYTLLSAGENNADFRWIVESANCHKILSVAPQSNGPCEYYVYGRSLSVIIKILQLDSSNSNLFGYILALSGLATFTASICFLFAIKKLNTVQYLVSILILFSLPVQLLIQRANIDILIFILLLVISCYKKSNSILPIVLISVTAIWKFYTLPLLLVYTLLYIRKRNLVITSLVVILSVILCLRDLSVVGDLIDQGGIGQFGFMAIYKNLLNIGLSKTSSLFLFITIICIIICTFYIKKSYLITTKPSKPVIIFGVTFLSCFFGGLNYDYRLVFAIPAVILSSGANFSFKLRKNVPNIILIISFMFTCEIGNTHNLFHRYEAYANLMKSLYLLSDLATFAIAIYIIILLITPLSNRYKQTYVSL